MSAAPPSLTLTALRDIPEVLPGSDLAALLAQALVRTGLTLLASDVLVVAQKIVSKAQGRYVRLADVTPGARASQLASVTGKDPRLIELILAESTEVLRAQRGLLIVRHRLGLVMANAGIDRSNVAAGADERVLLLPQDPEASAAALRTALAQRAGVACGLIISDSFGRAWRRGVVNVAIGAAGVTALLDRRGEADRAGRPLEITEVALADALAAAAGLLLGEAAEGTPAVLVRGFACDAAANPAAALVRPLAEDLFR
jgi:coenzyme F420-0:L-glutamate ligase / coenzyme F420-1:gamma-L-glutamate ligase